MLHLPELRFPSFHFQKPIDLVSTTEALLIRFRSDSTMSLKGFSASYSAIEPIERSENTETTSLEFVTPFPGSLKNIFANNDQIADETAKKQLATYDAFQKNNKYRENKDSSLRAEE